MPYEILAVIPAPLVFHRGIRMKPSARVTISPAELAMAFTKCLPVLEK